MRRLLEVPERTPPMRVPRHTCDNCERIARREDSEAFWIMYGPERREFLKKRRGMRSNADGVLVCQCKQMSFQMLR